MELSANNLIGEVGSEVSANEEASRGDARMLLWRGLEGLMGFRASESCCSVTCVDVVNLSVGAKDNLDGTSIG